ncbi:sulfotransferase [Sphingopyxis sp. OPL5]|uniref:sulfotransferase family protein n=1 Tax=Sphingopyxis sp. OPL5 TaxID=2486273 RepID=UPI00164DBBE9|nr:sulfotransferase [Sphingopyxis sp. OPL5]QNO26766.1 sulfotransferase [Sphingopyxis sp. OPL5]
MYLPNLLVIGAMKCGTSSLHNYLARHPDIFMSEEKEINFFTGSNSNQSLDWYKAQFPVDAPIRGESSQNYSKRHNPLFPGAAEAIKALIPDVKLIYVVRDPIERYRSHKVENYHGETPAARQWSETSDNQVMTGMYAYQLESFLDHFPMEQIKVVDADSLLNHRHMTMNMIFSFLGLEWLEDPDSFSFKTNENSSNGIPVHWQKSLPYRAARKLAPFDFDALMNRPAISRRLFYGLNKPDLSEEEVDRLKERYAKDVAQLRALTGMDFAGWQV